MTTPMEQFGERLTDEEWARHLFTGPRNPQPTTWLWLLKGLGVEDSTDQEQIEAVKTWLQDHTPAPALKWKLDKLGITP